MALIKCPECGHDVSDKAKLCPNCGYEIPKQENVEKRKNIEENDGWIRGSTPIQPVEKKEKKKVNKKLIVGIVIFFLFCAIIDSCSNSVKDKKTEETDTQNQVLEQTKQENNNESTLDSDATDSATPKEKKKDKFLEQLEKSLGKKVAKKTYNVLKKKIGFTNLEYKEKLGETDNYKIIANGYEVVITASDKLYRIFTPHEYTWYEDGKVKNTYKKIKSKTIQEADRTSYYIIAQEIVKNCLKSPSTAKFPSIVTKAGDIGMTKNGKLISVSGYVDAQNSFGAKIRSKWLVQFKVINLKEFSYGTKYVQIDGETLYGKYKK